MSSWRECIALILITFGFASSYIPHGVTFRPPPIIVRQPRRDRPKVTSYSSRNIVIVHRSTSSDDEITANQIKAGDGDALQALFSRKSDTDGLMTKEILSNTPDIVDLLSSGDLLVDELDDIWKNATKFPDVDASEERIDVDAFIKIYRDIDDIFEDEGNFDIDGSTMKNGILQENKDDANAIEEGDDPEETRDEQELELTFKTLCDDAGLVSKAALKEWSEIKELIGDGMLGEDEFDKIWECSAKCPGSNDQLDVEGFLSFNVELDDLFVFDDEGGEEDNGSQTATTSVPGENDVETPKMFYGEDLTPDVIFTNLANEKSLIGMVELRRWGDLQVMLSDGELLPGEFQDIYNNVPKVPGSNNEIDKDGFIQVYDAIDSLFENDEDEARRSASLKDELLSYVNLVNSNKDLSPCGLDSLDSEAEKVLELAEELEGEPCNIVISNEGNITPEDVVGDWELLYTTSATMKFNKGLSGLVPPGGKFGGLVQRLSSTKYLSDVEYVEKIDAGPSSFEVKVTGDWELRNSVSLFTGARSVALSIEPNKVSYGITSTKGDHWKSLGPMNLLSFSYLDENIRIMRGTTAVDNMFIFKRVQ